jgi:O-antigen/teichoic acid export membrane protein
MGRLVWPLLNYLRTKLKNILNRIYEILPPRFRNFWNRIEQSDIGSRMAKGTFWSLTGSLISRGLMLLASIIVARILGKTTYGELGMIRSTVTMFTVFAGFGLGLTATKYIAEFRETNKVKTGKIIGLSTIFAGITGSIIAIIILLTAPAIASKTINAPHLVNELRLGAIMLFFSALNGAQTGTLAGLEAFKSIAKVNLIAGLTSFPIQIGLTLLYGLTGSVIGFGINFLVLWTLNFIAVRKISRKFKIKIDFLNSWSEWPVLYKFSLPALFSGLLVSPVMWACNTMLVNQTNGYDEMAIFDAGFQWRNSVLFIPAILSQIALPLLSSESKNHKKFLKILKTNILLNLASSLVIAMLVILFSGFIMSSYGEGFIEGQKVLIILIITTILISINSVVGQAIASKNKMWYAFALNLIWAISILVLSYYFMSKNLGASGLATAYLISYILHTITQFYVLKVKVLKNT